MIRTNKRGFVGALMGLSLGGLLAEEGGDQADALASGALWSLQPVAEADVARGSAAVDALIGRGLDQRGLQPAPAADRRSLIRRVSYSLTGLPPQPALVDGFVSDSRPEREAFREVVDQLLSSPHYGEHWGRHWLDVVRYADTAGENSDHPLPHAWRYRNWVIDSFNRDLPYDEFVVDQLAGDLLKADRPTAERSDGIVATGYLAIARRFGHDIDKRKYLMYEDAIDNLGKAFLGLSISCARCHDHKHDPISMRDYYALYAVLDSTRFSFPGCEPKQQPRDLIPLPDKELEARRVAWEQKRDALQAEKDSIGQPAKSKALKDMAAGSFRVLSRGEVPDAGAVHVTNKGPLSLDVRKGEAIQLSILPRGNHGADTTIVDFVISHEREGETMRWSLLDLLDDFLVANPLPAGDGAAWCFLDTAGAEPKVLPVRKDGVDGKKELQSWSMQGGLPSVLVNRSDHPVKVWYTLPPRTFFCHPSQGGPVAISWLSPVEGTVAIDLKVSDGHPGGDGVAWQLEHFANPGIARAYHELGEAMVPRPELEKQIADHAANEPTRPVAYAVTEGEPKEARIHLRGDHEDLGEVVPTNFLGMLGGGELRESGSSGRRELARRIASADNPLTARVMVNRIWAWHFGRGLVASPNDFGNHGTPPSHPELLDFLARYFIEHDWSVKAMHRLILESRTYRQAARDEFPAESFAAFARRRLNADELRDTLLQASGELDRSPGEAHPFPAESTWSFTQHAPFAAEYETSKRSVYVMRKRNRTSPFFALFNGADPNASTARRDVTTVPTQALYFMNDPFFHRCAELFANRIRKNGTGAEGRLDFACRELFARPARPEEITAFREFEAALRPRVQGDETAADREIWNSYARILLGSNELLHID